MCRLLGWVAERPTSVVEILGEEGLTSFTALTAVHGDGWGMAWHDPDDASTRTVGSPVSAALDPTYAELVHTELGAAGMVHLRWATGGLPVAEANTHPFVDGGYAFAHNGHVAPLARLEELLSPESRAALAGDTDSERYFRFVLQSIREYDDEAEGVTRAIGTLMREFPDCSLNALMLTPRHMFAMHINSRATSPLRALRARFDNEDEIPSRHTSEYFAMDYRFSPDGLHVISSGLDEPGWDPVPADTTVMVDLDSRILTRLDPVAAMRAD